jgi:hypothetical protein
MELAYYPRFVLGHLVAERFNIDIKQFSSVQSTVVIDNNSAQIKNICDLCQKNRDDVSKMNKQIEHFTSFNLVPGSSILDNYFQNYVILEKQRSTPIVSRK